MVDKWLLRKLEEVKENVLKTKKMEKTPVMEMGREYRGWRIIKPHEYNKRCSTTRYTVEIKWYIERMECIE